MSGDPPRDPRATNGSVGAGPDAGVEEVDAADFAAGEIDEVIRFEVVDHGDAARVVHVVGEIDTLTAPVLRTRLDEHLAEVPLLVLDLSAVTFLGSAGLAVLVAAREEADRHDHRFRLVPGSRIVVRALEATGLLTLFDMADSTAEALAH